MRKRILRIISLCLVLLLTNSITIFALDLNYVSKETNINKEELLGIYNEKKTSEYPNKYIEDGVNIERFIDIILNQSQKYQINHEIIFKDILNRTNWLSEEDKTLNYNFSGIKDENNEIIKFASIEEGIEANIQLLFKYLDKEITQGLVRKEIDAWVNKEEYIKHIEGLEKEYIGTNEEKQNTEDIIEEEIIKENTKVTFKEENKTEVTVQLENNNKIITKITSLTIEGNNYTNSNHTITANGTSNNGVLYQFWRKDKSEGTWEMLQDYSEKNSAPWKPEKEGNYLYGVHIKDKLSKERLDSFSYKNISIKNQATEITGLKIEGSSYTNSNHTITANGTSSNGVLYQFWRKDKSKGKWEMLQDYSEKNSAPWKPEKEGNYLYGVHIKDKLSKERLDSFSYKNISIKNQATEITGLKIEGSSYTNSNHTITANGTSSNGVLYQFWRKDKSKGKWEMLQDYSEKNSATWKPEKEGNYLYGVHIKDKLSKKTLDAFNYKNINIRKLPKAQLLELNINQLEDDSSYRISASGTSLNGVLYQFWIKDLSTNKWTMIKDYSESNIANWSPERADNYWYGVHIKDKNSKERLDTHLYKTIRVNTIINYSDSKHSLEEALNIQMKRNPQTDYNGGGWKTAKKDDVRNLLDPKIFSKARLDAIKVKVDPLNFRTTPEIKAGNIITRLWKDETYVSLEKNNGWYKILVRGRIGWVHSSCVEETTVTNNQIFQFLDLSKPSGVKVEDVSNILHNKGGLSNQAKTFIEAGKIHNINEVYLISHALHETGNGHTSWVKGVPVDSKGRIFDAKTMNLINSKGDFIDSAGNLIRGIDKRLIDSKGRLIDSKGRLINQEGYILNSSGNPTSTKTNYSFIGTAPYKAEGKITTVYNMFGIGAYDSDPLRYGAEKAFREDWTSIEKAIIGGAKFVSNYYVNNSNGRQNTLYKMRWNPETPGSHQYATDIGWAYKQIHNIKRLYDSCNGYTLYLDIPRYREL